MSFKPNSWLLLALGGVVGSCTTTTPLVPGLSSFQVVATDLSNAIDAVPLNPVEVHLDITAIDKSGNTDTAYNGLADIFSSTGLILTGTGADGQYAPASNGPGTYPTIQFASGLAAVDVWAIKVYGETVYVVQDVSGTDAGAGDDLGASGASNAIRYGNLILSDTQITTDNITSPYNGIQVTFDESQTRCLAPPGDGGACPPASVYRMDMIVSAVGSDFYTVEDLNAFNADSGVPNPGFDPNTGQNDLPGTWASMYVYTYDAPNLYIGDRLTLLSGTIQEFAGCTQLNFPSQTLSADSEFSVPQAQDVPPPVVINPQWCIPRDTGDQTSDYTLCETSIDAIQLESLESGLVSVANGTMPSRWISCDLNGDGEIPYRTSSGCMPQSQGSFCEDDAGTGGVTCLTGEDCVANECLVECHADSDCPQTAGNVQTCIDDHCQNACMCRQYCDSLADCAELYEYNTYGQYTFTFPGADGGYWKFGTITKTGVPSFNPFSTPGIVVDFLNGVLEQVDASDPPWLIVPRIPSDMCCHADSPGCGPDAGLTVCPMPSSP